MQALSDLKITPVLYLCTKWVEQNTTPESLQIIYHPALFHINEVPTYIYTADFEPQPHR